MRVAFMIVLSRTEGEVSYSKKMQMKSILSMKRVL